jgi:hypothetical protein
LIQHTTSSKNENLESKQEKENSKCYKNGSNQSSNCNGDEEPSGVDDDDDDNDESFNDYFTDVSTTDEEIKTQNVEKLLKANSKFSDSLSASLSTAMKSNTAKSIIQDLSNSDKITTSGNFNVPRAYLELDDLEL